MSWIYRGQIVDDIAKCPENSVGFVYLIINLDNDKKYWGRKILHTHRKTKISLKEQEATNNRRKKNKIVVKESNWLDYTGSNATLNEDIKNGANIKKEILVFCTSKMQLNYTEEKILFCEDAILREDSYNDNIRAHYYRSKMK